MNDRLNSEWLAVSAFRGVLQIASRGDSSIATYKNSIDIGEKLIPILLDRDKSLLRRNFDSVILKEYKQRARYATKTTEDKIEPLLLLENDIERLSQELDNAKKQGALRAEYDKIFKRLKALKSAKDELTKIRHNEIDCILRDANLMKYRLPFPNSGHKFTDFQLPDGNSIRVRLFHPDKPEHLSGADIMYERHSPATSKVSIAAVQYKIWENDHLITSDPRIQSQIVKMQTFLCAEGFCKSADKLGENVEYRFPCCSAFLRPTDKLQHPEQHLMSTGFHLPLCKLGWCEMPVSDDADVISIDSIKHASIPGEMFQSLFNSGKIGSREIDIKDLEKIHSKIQINSENDNLLIHIQDVSFDEDSYFDETQQNQSR